MNNLIPDRTPYHLLVAVMACIASMLPGAALGQSLEAHFIEGFSQPSRISNVAAGTSGIVAERVAEEGSEVKAGDCLLRLDDAVQSQLLRLAASSKDSIGELNAARATLKSSLRRVTIIRDLATKGHATPDELLRAESDYELATANLLTIQEKQLLREIEYQKMLIESEKYCITAPFDGVLVEYSKEKGEFVGPADPNICTIADLSTLSVEFFVMRDYIGDIKTGTKLEIVFVESNRSVVGTVHYVSPFPNGETKTFTVKVHVPNHDRELNAGERCQLERVIRVDTGMMTSKPNRKNKID